MTQGRESAPPTPAPDVARATGHGGTRLDRLGNMLLPADRSALELWFLSRIAVFVAATFAPWLLFDGEPVPGVLERWSQWDADLYIEIARYGYGGNPQQAPDPGLPAFFPGLPLLLRLVHVAVPNWTAAGLLISLAAGAVATIALSRLGEYEGPPGTGQRAVLALLVCPWAVFLAAGYTEALFLAFAVPAWLLARRGHWLGAALVAAGASSVRITGVFLAVALVVEWVTRARPRRLASLPCLAIPFVPPALYSTYLYVRTGDWLAWKHAQEVGWGRSLVPPWEALRTTWNVATNPHSPHMWSFRFELLAAGVGVALVLWLLARRQWGELTYVGIQVAALTSSAYYLSIPRALLLWWPLWLLVAGSGLRRPWLYRLYVAVSTPLMIIFTLAFTHGDWAG